MLLKNHHVENTFYDMDCVKWLTCIITSIPHSKPKEDSITTLFGMKGAGKIWTQLFPISKPMRFISSLFCHTQLTTVRIIKCLDKMYLLDKHFRQDIYTMSKYSGLILLLTSTSKQFELKYSPRGLLLCLSLQGSAYTERILNETSGHRKQTRRTKHGQGKRLGKSPRFRKLK